MTADTDEGAERYRPVERIRALQDELAQARDTLRGLRRLQIELYDLRQSQAKELAEREAAAAAASVATQAIEVERLALVERLLLITEAHNALLSSAFWRLTSPLRRLSAALPPAVRTHIRRLGKAAWWAATPWRIPERLARRASSSAHTVASRAQFQLQPERSPTSIAHRVDENSYAHWIRLVEPILDIKPPLTMEARVPSDTHITFLLPNPKNPSLLSATFIGLRALSDPDWECLLPKLAGSHWTALLADVENDQRLRMVQVPSVERGTVLASLFEHVSTHWVAVLDAGDVLEPEILSRVTLAIAENPTAAIVYCDEDELADGVRCNPQLKPAWSPQLLQTFNYLGRLTLLRRDMAASVGGFREGDGEGAEWSLNLRTADLAGQTRCPIVRVPRVLCHRVRNEVQARLACSIAAEQHSAVLANYWQRHGHQASIEVQADGTLRSNWESAEPPLVSAIIITRHNDPTPLWRIVNGLIDDTRYKRIEIIASCNIAFDPEAGFDWAHLQEHPTVQMVPHDPRLGYSVAANRCAAAARGELLLFMTDDLTVTNPDWLDELVRVAGLSDVGVVAPRLRSSAGGDNWPGPTGRLLGHHNWASPDESPGIFGSQAVPRNSLTVPGGCMMVRRTLFNLVGRFVEAYPLTESQIVLCLRARRMGWHIVHTPWSKLICDEDCQLHKNSDPPDKNIIARELSRLGVDEDPFFHPGLSPNFGKPTLRKTGEGDSHAFFADYGYVEKNAAVFDPYDDAAVLHIVQLPRALLFWPPQSSDTIDDVWAAARWLMVLLRSRPDLRVRFPHALSEAEDGSFYEWLLDERTTELELPDSSKEHLRSALAGAVGDRAREVYFARPDVREAFPLGPLPSGGGTFFRWLVRHGCNEMGLRLEECWWWLLSANENPAAEAVRIYLMSPSWQHVHPTGLTLFGSAALATWIADSHGISPDVAWLKPGSWRTGLTAADELRIGFAAHRTWRLACPDGFRTPNGAKALLEYLAGPDGGLTAEKRTWCDARRTDGTASLMANVGVNVIGHFCYPSGLRVSVEALSDAIESVGVAVSRRDVRTSPDDDPQHSCFAGLELNDITIIHVQPEPFFSTAYQQADLSPRHPRTYRIAYWYWELETAPPHWAEIASTVDEVWVATRFVAAALQRTLPVPVRIVFPGVGIGRFTPLSRDAFDIPGWQDGRFTFLFSFHMASVMERKNPLGLIEAFRRAFRPDEPVDLLIKTTSSPQYARDSQRLHDAAEGANIHVIDWLMPREQVLALTSAADAYVSLHRSEGLGLTMAEAMLMGKPVIATRYGGNLDFMNDDNSLLVDYEMVTLDSAEPPYDAGRRWAQPSIEIAASLMRQLYDDPAAAAALGARGRTDALRRMSPEVAGAQAATRLFLIYASLDR